MKILFIGTVEFSLKALSKLIDLNANIVGVCTKEISTFNSDYANLVPLCKKNDIKYKYIKDINSKENILWIQSLEPDIIFCFGWSSLIKKELLDLAPMGIIGFHPASLPQNRGRHPIIWALALGLKESASTFFFMDEGADSGDILSQVFFKISETDTASTLYDKIVQIALLQIKNFLPKLQNKTFIKIKQDHNQSNVWRKRNKKDGLIDFRMNSLSIYNLIRSLSKPYVGASILYNKSDIIVWKSQIVENNISNIESGKVLEVENNTILVKTYDGAIRLLEHEFILLPKVGEYL